MKTQEAVDFANVCRKEIQKILPEHFHLTHFGEIPSKPRIVFAAVDCYKQLSGLKEHCTSFVEIHTDELLYKDDRMKTELVKVRVMAAAEDLSEFIRREKEEGA